MVIRETERLIIRKLGLKDAPFVLDLLNSPSWLKYIGDRGIKTIKQAEEYLSNGSLKSYLENGFGFYLVVEKKLDLPIGTCGLVKRNELEDIDLGFAFLPQFEGKGYGYESSQAIIDHAIRDLEINKLVAITTPDNHASNKLLQKLKFNLEKEILFGEKKELLNLYERKL